MKTLARSIVLWLSTLAVVIAAHHIAHADDSQLKKQPPATTAKPGPKVPDNVLYERDVQYGAAGERVLKLDVIRPREESKEPRPALVWIHGGGWSGGDKSSGLGLLTPFVARGDYIGFSVGYRLSGEAKWPAQIHDCKAAIRWIKANAAKFNLDPKRIGVWGGSAGGHLVSLLGTSSDVKELEGNNGTPDQSTRVACVADFCGPSDFPNFFQGRTVKSQGGIAALLGGTVEEKKAEAIAASPVTHVNKDAPPFLIVHGTVDNVVPIAQAETLYNTLKKAGVDATFIRMDGGGHGIGGPEIGRRLTAFFDKQLLGKKVEVSAEAIKVSEAPNKLSAREREQIDIARLQMEQISKAVQLFKFQCRRAPAKIEELWDQPADLEGKWRGPYLPGDDYLKDPWKHPFRMECQEADFTLTSLGPDGRAGTADDIVIKKKF